MDYIKRFALTAGLLSVLASCGEQDEPQAPSGAAAPSWQTFGTPVRTEILVFEGGEVPFETSIGPHESAARQPRFWRLDEREELHLDLLRTANPQLSPLRFGYEAQVFQLSDRLAYQVSRRTQINPHRGSGGYADYSGTLTIFDPQTFRIEKQTTFDSYLGAEFATLVFALEPGTLYAHYHRDKRTYEVDVFSGRRRAEVAALSGLSFEAVHKYGDEIILDVGYGLQSWRVGESRPTALDLGGTLHGVIAWQDDLVICNVESSGAKVAIYSLRERRLLTPLLSLGMRPTCAYYDRAGGLYYSGERGDRDMVFRVNVSPFMGVATASPAAKDRQDVAYAAMNLGYFIAGIHSLYVSPDNRRLYVLYTYGVPVYSEARLAIYDLDADQSKYPLLPRRVVSADKIYRPTFWRVTHQ